jgi:hypothetical protein
MPTGNVNKADAGLPDLSKDRKPIGYSEAPAGLRPFKDLRIAVGRHTS